MPSHGTVYSVIRTQIILEVWHREISVTLLRTFSVQKVTGHVPAVSQEVKTKYVVHTFKKSEWQDHEANNIKWSNVFKI